MSLNSLNRDISRIKRKLGINFEKLDYEHALERHYARFYILEEEKLVSAFDLFESIEKELNEPKGNDPHDHDTSGYSHVLRQKAERARKFLGDDTPERWKKDHKILVAYHLKLYGNLSKLKSQAAFGSTPDEMWANNEANIFASLDKEKTSKRLSKEEKNIQRAKMEKKYGKPVRLLPDPCNYTYKHYIPQFAEGDPHWDLRRIFPYEDFPEHDGKSIIELE